MGDKKKAKAGGPFDALRPLRDELAKKQQSDAAAKPPGAKRLPEAPVRASGPPDDTDDAVLLHRLFSGVTPIDRSRGRVPKERLEPSPAAQRAANRGAVEVQAEADEVREHLRTLVEGHGRFEVTDDGRRVEGRRVDVPADVLRKLRRGQFPIDARIDLHGMTVAAASEQLEAFLRSMRARGERCILLIHGKGEHSPNGTGVLRGEVAAWLSQGRSAAHVAAFATAQRDDGGEGAAYVLLLR